MDDWVPLPLPAALTGSGGPLFVGRSEELGEIEQIWESVTDASRQALCIGGEPGVGKTRLAREVALTLHRHGAAVLWGGCHPDLEAAYRPLVAALDGALAASEAGTFAPLLRGPAAHLARVLPGVTRHRGELAGTELAGTEPAGTGSRLVLFDGVVELLVALAARQPVVLVVEDVHWAASATVQLLSHLVESTARARLLLIVTHRTTLPDRRDDVTHALANIYRHDGVSRLDLAGLDTDDVADFLCRGAGIAADDARASAAVLRDQTGGNPLFLRELWRELAGRGGLEALHCPGFAAPATVRDTLDRRMGSLEPAHRDVLELAAVAGERVALATLVDAGVHPVGETLAAVDVAVDSGLLLAEPGTPRGYRFAHALLRQAVLDRLPASREVAWHAAVAGALERRGDDEPEVVARLAHHYERAESAGHSTTAVHYLERAAGHAERSLAHDEAASLHERAAALVTADPRRREELLLAAAGSRVSAGDFAAARKRYEKLAASADPPTRVRAAIGYENASWRPGLPGHRSLELLGEAMRGYAPKGADDPLQVRALACTARALSFIGDPAAEAVGERALASARRSGDAELIAAALETTLWRGMTPELTSVLRPRAVELAGLAVRSGNTDQRGVAVFLGAISAYIDGDAEALGRARRELAWVVRAGGQPFFRYMAGCETAAYQYACGDFGAAGRMIDTLDELVREFGVDRAEGSHGVQTFVLRRATGRLTAVRGLIDGTEDPEAHWAPGLLALYVELELWAPAARLVAYLLDRLERYRATTSTWAGVLVFLADAACRLADTATAAAVLEHLASYRGRNLLIGQFVAAFGSADREIARLESLLGTGDPEAGFASALDMDRRMGATTHQVETLAAWSAHAASRDGTGAGSRAGRLRAEARVLARRIGHQRALRELGSSGAAAIPAPAREYPDGLTEREVEVLVLVAEGLANREIAERLFISPNTAANHVRSILMKTGAANRTQAAIYTAERGLLPDRARAGSSAHR